MNVTCREAANSLINFSATSASFLYTSKMGVRGDPCLSTQGRSNGTSPVNLKDIRKKQYSFIC